MIHYQFVESNSNDIKQCGSFVAVVVHNVHAAMPGKVTIYTLYDAVNKNMTKVRDIAGTDCVSDYLSDVHIYYYIVCF